MKILNLSLLLLTTGVFAQNIELKWAEKIKTKGSVSILGGKNGSFYTGHTNSDKQLVCRQYDGSMNMVNEKEVNFNFESNKYAYTGAYFLKDKIVHFVKEHVRKEDKNYLYATITDLKLNKGEQALVLDEASEDALEFGSRSISPDSTKVVIYNVSKAKKNDPSLLNFKVYDSSFKDVLLDKSAELPIKAKNFSTETIEVDNFGNVYVLAKVFKEKDEKAKDQSLYYYKLIVFNKQNAAKEFDFDYPNKDIESIDIIPGENNTLVCTGFLKILNSGFFGKGKKTLISDEMFASSIDCATLTLKSANKYELEGLYPEKPKRAEDYVPYKVRNIFHRKDGGSVVVAEQYKLQIVTTSTKYGTQTTYYYYYCDIAVININNKSEVESVSKMPKYQMNAGNPSIIATHLDGNTYIFYEDLKKNLEAENDKQTKRSTSSIWTSDSKNALFVMTVAPSGEMKKEIVYDYKESKIRPNIKASRVVSKNEIVLNADDQIGVIKISNKG